MIRPMRSLQPKNGAIRERRKEACNRERRPWFSVVCCASDRRDRRSHSRVDRNHASTNTRSLASHTIQSCGVSARATSKPTLRRWRISWRTSNRLVTTKPGTPGTKPQSSSSEPAMKPIWQALEILLPCVAVALPLGYWLFNMDGLLDLADWLVRVHSAVRGNNPVPAPADFWARFL